MAENQSACRHHLAAQDPVQLLQTSGSYRARGGWDLSLAKLLSLPWRSLTCHPWLFLAPPCGVWVRAAVLGPGPANHVSGHAQAPAGLLVQHPTTRSWEPATALQGKDMGVIGVYPSDARCGVWITVMGRPGLGSLVGLPATAHSCRLLGPYPFQNGDWEGVSWLT